MVLTIDDWWPVTYTEEGFSMEPTRGVSAETADSAYLAMREAEVERLREELRQVKTENAILRLKLEGNNPDFSGDD